MAAVTIHSDFGAPQDKVSIVFHLLSTKWWDWMSSMIYFFSMFSFKLAFPLFSFTFIKRLFLVPLHFMPSGWYHLLIWGYWYFPPKSWFFSLIYIQPTISSDETEFDSHNKHTLPATQELTLQMDFTRWSTLKSDDYILCSWKWRSSVTSAKARPEMTVAQIMNVRLQNSDLNWRT